MLAAGKPRPAKILRYRNPLTQDLSMMGSSQPPPRPLARATAERKELYEEEHPETVSVRKRGGPGRGHKNETEVRAGFVDSFIAATAKATGKGQNHDYR
jgi:hypothetical protein